VSGASEEVEKNRESWGSNTIGRGGELGGALELPRQAPEVALAPNRKRIAMAALAP
jgi:hypothetical protein